MDCLVRGVLGLGKQVTLATGFEPECTGTELSSCFVLTVRARPSTEPRTKQSVPVELHVLERC